MCILNHNTGWSKYLGRNSASTRSGASRSVTLYTSANGEKGEGPGRVRRKGAEKIGGEQGWKAARQGRARWKGDNEPHQWEEAVLP
eukprot:8867123-Heterocapsa_arctica.AAC.1